jgi:hypothetical protein
LTILGLLFFNFNANAAETSEEAEAAKSVERTKIMSEILRNPATVESIKSAYGGDPDADPVEIIENGMLEFLKETPHTESAEQRFGNVPTAYIMDIVRLRGSEDMGHLLFNPENMGPLWFAILIRDLQFLDFIVETLKRSGNLGLLVETIAFFLTKALTEAPSAATWPITRFLCDNREILCGVLRTEVGSNPVFHYLIKETRKKRCREALETVIAALENHPNNLLGLIEMTNSSGEYNAIRCAKGDLKHYLLRKLENAKEKVRRQYFLHLKKMNAQ